MIENCPFCNVDCDHEVVSYNFYRGFGTVVSVKRRPQSTPEPKPKRRATATTPKRWASK